MSATANLSRDPASPCKMAGRDRCRTCVQCRRKKVKCDGQHPSCKACVLRGHTCEYPHDSRRSALRTKREAVTALQQHVRVLENKLSSKTMQTATSENKGAKGNCLAIRYPQDEEAQNASPRYQSAVQPVGNTEFWPHDSSQTMALEQDTVADDPAQDSGESNKQFYGATSLLRDRSSTMSGAAPPKGTGPLDLDEETKEMCRDMLISYSAIQRQQETTLRSQPSIISNTDFDQVDADVALHLLDLHWNRQHLSYLLTYRPAIMNSIINGGPYANKLLLNAIYFQSSRYSDRSSMRTNPKDPSTHGEVFLQRFNALLGHHISQPSIPTIMALLVCGACLVPHGKQSTGWIYCGIAYRMITDLGLHLGGDTEPRNRSRSKPDVIHTEICKRVYWAAYVGDKLQSLFLGRATAMPKSAGTVSRDYLDTYEELEEWTPYIDESSSHSANCLIPAYSGRPGYALSNFRRFLELCDIAEVIVDDLYSVKSARSSQEYLIRKRDEIRVLLQEWADSTPPWLAFEVGIDPTPPPHQITPQ